MRTERRGVCPLAWFDKLTTNGREGAMKGRQPPVRHEPVEGHERNGAGVPPPPSQGWIPAFAGKTVGCRRARASGYPERRGGAGPLPRPRDGFLLSQERRWGVVVPAQAGTQRGEVGTGLSRVPGMDSCLRRNGCCSPALPARMVRQAHHERARGGHERAPTIRSPCPAEAGMRRRGAKACRISQEMV